jgi:protocatechuate 3,4-dioxygenase beta subunit
MEETPTTVTSLFSRRDALALLTLGGVGFIATACGKSGKGSTAASVPTSTTAATGAASTGQTRATSAAACTLMPELTEGPYYLDLHKVRSDITEGRPGAPLELAVTIVDATTCAPIKDAAVDIWHCDAGGEYSGFGGSGSGGGPGGGTVNQLTFLRGTQVTDAAGLATFKTLYPGWYTGRAVHIHVKVHVTNAVKHTGQLFFPDDVTDTVYKAQPYNARGSRDVRNAADSIYRGGGASTVVAVAARGAGYAAPITLGVKRT